jgi:hypothetical protein
VQDREKQAYREYWYDPNIIFLPSEITTIAATRDWIVEFAIRMRYDKLLMLDDDLDFAIRREDEPTKFRVPTHEELEYMFVFIEALLNDYAHVGISGREGANRNTNKLVHNTRMMRILGYAPRVLQQHNIKFNQGPGLMEDFRVTLELLTRGYKNVLVNSFVHNQPGSQSPGGCSEYRTPDRQKQSAEALADAFPEFVRVVQKASKNWKGQWEGMRYDVNIRWKDAYNSSGARQPTEVLDGGKGQHPNLEI